MINDREISTATSGNDNESVQPDNQSVVSQYAQQTAARQANRSGMTALGNANLGPMAQPNAVAPTPVTAGSAGAAVGNAMRAPGAMVDRMGGAIGNAVGPALSGAAQGVNDFMRGAFTGQAQPAAVTVDASAGVPRQTPDESKLPSAPVGTSGPGQADQDASSSQVGNAPAAGTGSAAKAGLDPNKTYTMQAPDPTKGPVSAAVAGNQPGMTTEQANAYYGAQRQAMEAQEAQRQQAGIVSRSAQTNASSASWAQQQAENRAMRAENGAGPVGSQSWRSARLARQDAEGMGRATAAAETAFGNANAGVGIINPVQDFLNRQKGIAAASGVPGELAQQTAATAHTQAQTGLVGAQTKLAGQDSDLKSFQVQQASHMQNLSDKALAGDKDAQDNLNTYRQIEKGEGGALTQQQVGKLYTDYAGHLAITGQTPDPAQFMAGILKMSTLAKGGQAAQPPADWVERQMKANPTWSKEQIIAQYKG